MNRTTVYDSFTEAVGNMVLEQSESTTPPTILPIKAGSALRRYQNDCEALLIAAHHAAKGGHRAEVLSNLLKVIHAAIRLYMSLGRYEYSTDYVGGRPTTPLDNVLMTVVKREYPRPTPTAQEGNQNA